jgi:uncharacterized protein YndB with AHSA1/START domain
MAPFFKMSQQIRRPIEAVFATATHLDQFPEWSPLNPLAKKLSHRERSVKGPNSRWG